MRDPVSMSQRRRVLSSEAETRYLESEEKARSETPCSWPSSSWRRETVGAGESDEDLTTEMRRVLSAEEEARRRPSDENLTAEIARLWGVRVLARV